MRITGGKASGIPIKAPKGEITRPATDRMREAVFSSLGEQVNCSKVADLFAGTGAYGLEAISRGATKADFYETNRDALKCLKQNCQSVLKACELNKDTTRIFPSDVYRVSAVTEKADLIFIDPPYQTIESQIGAIFRQADKHAKENAFLILELPGSLEFEPTGWTLTRRLGKLKRDSPSTAIFERSLT